MIHVLFLQPRTALSRGEDGEKSSKYIRGLAKDLEEQPIPLKKALLVKMRLYAMNS